MRYIFFSICLLLYFSCQEKPSDLVKKGLKEKGIEIPKEMKFYIILPSVGCGACIDEAILFLEKNQEAVKTTNSELLIIFTSILSKKMLNRALQAIDLPPNRVLYDFDNNYSINSDKAIYPAILYLKNGEIENIEYQSPESPEAFKKLEELIN